MMSGGEGAITAGVKNTKQKRVKKRRPHFARPREKVLRGNQDPLAAVFSWGVSHHMRELDSIAQPKMLLTEDFKSYSKLKVENHAFNRTSLPGHYKVKEYCPLVFRALRERFGVNEDDFCESLSLHQIEPLITHDEIEKIEDDEIKKGGKFRKRDVLRSFCGRFTVSLVSSDDIEQLHHILQSYYAHIVEQKGETLLPNWLGLYRVGISNRSDRYLLVTRSLADKCEPLAEQYILRVAQKEKEKEKKEKKETIHMKHAEWAEQGRKLNLSAGGDERLRALLERDVLLLQKLKLINYAIYVGLGGGEEQPQQQEEREQNHDSGHDGQENEADQPNSSSDSEDEYYANHNHTFKQENATPIYLGIHDILTHYDTKKKAANAVKTAKHGHDKDDKNNPEKYGKDFVEFVNNL